MIEGNEEDKDIYRKERWNLNREDWRERKKVEEKERNRSYSNRICEDNERIVKGLREEKSEGNKRNKKRNEGDGEGNKC